jgi:hypothetical protein
MLNVGEIRKLIKGKKDNETIPLYICYGEVCTDSVFVRTDAVAYGKKKDFPTHALVEGSDPPGVCLTLSLVDPEDEADEEEDDDG